MIQVKIGTQRPGPRHVVPPTSAGSSRNRFSSSVFGPRTATVLSNAIDAMTSDAAKRVKLIERVRALLAMTTKNGCTEAEAMVAAAKAAQLMEEYDLELGDVKSLNDERIAQQSRPFAADGRPREMHAAGIYVSLAIANFFDCKCWRSGTEVIFFGTKDDVELAHAMLAMIRLAMDRELMDFMASDGGRRAGHPRSVMVSFMKGMGHRLSNRLTQIKADRTAHVRAKGKDLVVVKGDLVEAAYAELVRSLNLKPQTQKPAKNGLAYFAGVEAGDRVNLGNKEVEDKRPYWPWNWQTSRPARPQSNFNASVAAQKLLLWRFKVYIWVRQVGHTVRAILKMVASLGFFASMIGLVYVVNDDAFGPVTKPFVERFPHWYVVALTVLGGPCTACGAFYLRAKQLEERERLRLWRTTLDYRIEGKTLQSHLTHLWHQGEIALWCLFIYAGSQLGPYFADLRRVPVGQAAHDQALKLLSNPNVIFAHLAVGTCWIVLGCLLADTLWRPRPPLARTHAVTGNVANLL